MNTNEIKNKIAKGELDFVVDYLLEKHKESNDLIILKNQLTELNKKARIGALEKEYEKVERTKIISGILSFLDLKQKNDLVRFPKKSNNNFLILYALLFFLGIFFIFCYFNANQKNVKLPLESINTEITNKAWKAYDRRNYKSAIEHSQKCISMFRNQAFVEEKKLLDKKHPMPDIYCPSCLYKIRDSIFARGILNDVGTCYFILGDSYKKLGKDSLAMQAYIEASKLTYALTWDKRYKGFWSPSEKSKIELNSISKNETDK